VPINGPRKTTFVLIGGGGDRLERIEWQMSTEGSLVNFCVHEKYQDDVDEGGVLKKWNVFESESPETLHRR
jgi:hypothetical protein